MTFTLPDAVESTTIQIFWSWVVESWEEIWQKRLLRSGWKPLLQGKDTKSGWKKSKPWKRKTLKNKFKIQISKFLPSGSGPDRGRGRQANVKGMSKFVTQGFSLELNQP